MNDNLKKILAAREARYQLRLNLHQKYNLPVVVITMNIPGPDKSNQLIKKAFQKFTAEIVKIFKKDNITIEQQIINFTFAGPEAFFVLNYKEDCSNLKKKLIKIEQHHGLGRLLDLDLYQSDNKAISRKSIDRRERQCLLCEEDARKCIIEKRHSLVELNKIIKEIILQYLEENSGSV